MCGKFSTNKYNSIKKVLIKNAFSRKIQLIPAVATFSCRKSLGFNEN